MEWEEFLSQRSPELANLIEEKFRNSSEELKKFFMKYNPNVVMHFQNVTVYPVHWVEREGERYVGLSTIDPRDKFMFALSCVARFELSESELERFSYNTRGVHRN